MTIRQKQPIYKIVFRTPYDKQREFIRSKAKRKIIRAGRRSGKTTGISILAGERFLQNRRVLYATPTADQLDRFWFEICLAFADPIARGAIYKNETKHIIEIPGTETRIRAKTAWNANTMRGDFADVLIYDEFQLMAEETWDRVGAPMLLDNDGDAIFIYTPPSLKTHSVTKADDPMHAAKMFQRAVQDTTGRWASFHFTSHDNPHISHEALSEITKDMTSLAYRQEILAEDLRDNPRALWKREWIEEARVIKAPPMYSIVVGMDPAATSKEESDSCGIVAAGARTGDDGNWHLYILEDATVRGTPAQQAKAALGTYHKLKADYVVVESNNGGEWLAAVIHQIDPNVPVKLVHASRGKRTRAEPVSAVYEQHRGHHVGSYSMLEDELCQWEPGLDSPNRLDALVWAGTHLVVGKGSADWAVQL